MSKSTLVREFEKKLDEFEYSILSEYYIPNSKDKTQLRISKRMDEILDKMESSKIKK